MSRRRFVLLPLVATGSIALIVALRARGGDAQEIVVFAAVLLRDSNKKGKL
jgi:anthranilate phosphoribosyltransferase